VEEVIRVVDQIPLPILRIVIEDVVMWTLVTCKGAHACEEQKFHIRERSKWTMRVHRVQVSSANDVLFEILDDAGHPIEAISSFMRHLRARGCSPNTLSAYCYDLMHFLTFLKEQQLSYQDFTPPRALTFVE